MAEKSTYNYSVTKQTEIQSFLDYWQQKLPSKSNPLTVKELLDFPNVNGLTNKDVIWGTYSSEEKTLYENEYSNDSLPYIKAGTQITVPIANTPLQLEKPSREGQFLSQGDFKAFWGPNYDSIITDDKFVPDNVVTLIDSKSPVKTKIQPLNIRVYLYLKALNKVLDISPYVISCNVSKTKETGDFAITLAPFRSDGSSTKAGGSYFEIFNTMSDNRFAVKDCLEKLVQYNDIVFIRFERLELEKGNPDKSIGALDLEVPLSKLANSTTDKTVWDMIGILDFNESLYSASENARSTTLSGRDLSKLFTDDGSYFLPLREIEGSLDHWWNPGLKDSSWFKRNIITGSYDYLWSYGFKRIREMVWFIINAMSNIGLVKDEVFEGWKDRRTESYSVQGSEDSKVNGIWQIVKVFVEDSVDQRILVDSSFGNPDGTLMDFLKRACQQPFVEFYFDTYVDTMDLIIRQPPFIEKAIMGAFNDEKCITVTADNVYETNFSYDNRIYSWYQLHVQNNWTGASAQTSLAFAPIIFLNEYAELFGNKKLEVNDIYLSLPTTRGIEEADHLATLQASALSDLMFLVETNAYLPFTRRGTIAMNGDRRIKVGTFIKFELTNEFFYVTGVTNTAVFSQGGLSRQTILQVERGMYIPILEGSSTSVRDTRESQLDRAGGKIKPSYFKIVNLDKMKTAIEKAKRGELITNENPALNREQFDYFLNRKMYGRG